MAGNKGESELRTVVDNLVNHPGFKQIVSDAVNNVSSTSDTATSLSRPLFNSPQREMQSLFRTGGQGLRGRGGGTVPSFVPVLGSNRSNARRGRSRSSGKVQRKKFTHEVVLLSNPNEKYVVRGSNKADLMRQGQVIQCFDFYKEWSEEEVLEHLSNAFSELLDGKSFHIMLGVGNDLVAPNLAPGQTLDGEKIAKLFSQKIIWLLPVEDLINDAQKDSPCNSIVNDLKISDSESTSAHDSKTWGDDLFSNTFDNGSDKDIVDGQCPTTSGQQMAFASQNPSTNDGQKSLANNQYPSTCETWQRKLREIFPHKNEIAIESAVANILDLEEAISKILHEKESSDEELMNRPLLPKKARLDHVDELHNFITVVKKFEIEEDFYIIREKSFISQVMGKYKNPRFNLGCKVSVQFRSFGNDELGVDAGGPTKEFFNELMKELQTGGYKDIRFFEGEKGPLTPMYDYDLLSSGIFQIIGKMILHSVLNGCKGLAGLSSAVAHYILTGSRTTIHEFISVKDIPDPCLRENLNELISCGDDDLQTFTDSNSAHNISNILIASGFPHLNITPSNKQLAYECCLSHEVITKRIPALDDLRRGLALEAREGKTTILDLAAKHPEIKNVVFPEATDTIHLHDVKKLIAYGNDENVQATQTKLFFEKYLVEISGRESTNEECMKDLLQFWTAWPSLPTMGEELNVAFLSNGNVLPIVDTCFQMLKLPIVHEDYASFRRSMDTSIHGHFHLLRLYDAQLQVHGVCREVKWQ